MIVHTYWDQVSICENAIPDSILQLAETGFLQSTDFQTGDVPNTNPTDSDYKFLENMNDVPCEFYDYLLDLGIIPELNNHVMSCSARFHRLEPNGKIAWHTDAMSSVAVTIYLNEVVGGELQIRHVNNEEILIRPQRGMVVVIKCGVPHRVLEVKEGIRNTIQLFISYHPKELLR